MKSSKIEMDVPIVPRCGVVWRVSDVEKNGRLTDGIKLAALQHLYFRLLLDIGDSGTHNVLVREDAMPGRFVVGVDLEERRVAKDVKQKLDYLFKKGASNAQVHLYNSFIEGIKSLTMGQMDKCLVEFFHSVEIDGKRLFANMELWYQFEQLKGGF